MNKKKSRLDLSNKEDLEKISRRINYAYNKVSNGIGSSEDCIQEVLLKYCEGKSQKQTVDQSVIDYLRAISGDKRTLSYNERRNFENSEPIQETELADTSENFDGRSLLDGECFDKLLGLCGNQIDRAILGLSFKWGLSETEISNLFGISISRVCQRLKRVQECVSEKIKSQESRISQKKVQGLLCSQTKGKLRGMEQNQNQGLEGVESLTVETFNEESF